MGGQGPTVRINPDVLRWAMAGSGWNAEELSEETDLKRESIRRWEMHSAPIKVKDLRKISRAIKRPLSVLLLPKPPEEKDLTDYRKVGGTDTGKLSRKTLAVIRNVRYIQSNAGELLKLRSEDAWPNITPRTLKDDPETVAEAERKYLGLDLGKRNKGENIDEFVRAAYLSLKAKIESFNIFVMQATMDINEARGFALADGYPRMILVNSRDKPRPQLFTLLHEYAHLLLKTDGICLTNSDDFKGRPGRKDVSVERWCNNFAGAIIMPKKAILRELDNRADHAPDKVVASLATKFCTSKTATVVRILNLLGKDPLREGYYEYYKAISSKPITGTGGGGGEGGRDMAKECVTRNGMRYVKMVSDSREKGLITTTDMIKYLDLKTKHFEKLDEIT